MISDWQFAIDADATKQEVDDAPWSCAPDKSRRHVKLAAGADEKPGVSPSLAESRCRHPCLSQQVKASSKPDRMIIVVFMPLAAVVVGQSSS